MRKQAAALGPWLALRRPPSPLLFRRRLPHLLLLLLLPRAPCDWDPAPQAAADQRRRPSPLQLPHPGALAERRLLAPALPTSVYMMAFPGARGNILQVRLQVRQLVGMRQLLSDPQGQVLGFPVESKFKGRSCTGAAGPASAPAPSDAAAAGSAPTVARAPAAARSGAVATPVECATSGSPAQPAVSPSSSASCGGTSDAARCCRCCCGGGGGESDDGCRGGCDCGCTGGGPGTSAGFVTALSNDIAPVPTMAGAPSPSPPTFSKQLRMWSHFSRSAAVAGATAAAGVKPAMATSIAAASISILVEVCASSAALLANTALPDAAVRSGAASGCGSSGRLVLVSAAASSADCGAVAVTAVSSSAREPRCCGAAASTPASTNGSGRPTT